MKQAGIKAIIFSVLSASLFVGEVGHAMPFGGRLGCHAIDSMKLYGHQILGMFGEPYDFSIEINYIGPECAQTTDKIISSIGKMQLDSGTIDHVVIGIHRDKTCAQDAVSENQPILRVTKNLKLEDLVAKAARTDTADRESALQSVKNGTIGVTIACMDGPESLAPFKQTMLFPKDDLGFKITREDN